jgi:hypothetical protein
VGYRIYWVEYVVEGSRCIVCGDRISAGQLCDWCRDPRLEEVLRGLIEEVDSQLKQATRIDVKANPTFSLIADLGILGTRHPLLSSPSKIIAMLITEGGKGIREFRVRDLYYGQRDVKPFLMMLHDLGFVVYDEAKEEVTIPDDSILLKIKHELEIDPRRNPAAAFALGYATLRSILKTLELAKQRVVQYGEAVTCLYSITKSTEGKVRITMPKSYMATLSFVLGFWARGFTEFSELDLHKFMVDRGVTGKEFKEVLATLSCAFATAHGLYERASVEHLGRVVVHRFRLSEDYVKLYERVRARQRAR